MKKTLFLLFVLLPLFTTGQPGKKLYKTFGSVKVYEVESKGVYIFRAGFSFDADGAAKAYHKNDNVALDFVANAGKPVIAQGRLDYSRSIRKYTWLGLPKETLRPGQ